MECDVSYVGIDIVSSSIDKNTETFQGDGIRFKNLDICTDRLPEGDLLLVRDVVFNLCFQDIFRLFRNIKRTKYRYVLITSHTSKTCIVNKDITTGDYRPVDLFSSPFRLKSDEVIETIDEGLEGELTRTMVLFNFDDLCERLV